MRGIEKRIEMLEEKAGLRSAITPMTIKVVFAGLPESEGYTFYIGDEQMRGQVDIPDDKE